MAKENETFAELVNRARQFPEDTGKGANSELPPGLLGSLVPPGEPLVNGDDLRHGPKRGDPNHAQGVPNYNLAAHVKRFVIGVLPAEKFGDEGDDCDDSIAYESLMNDMLQGRAIPRWEEKNILRNGTLVIIVSWMTPLPKKEKKETEH